jgi:4-hydroxy-2-oxoheptanedioate aldolase
MRTNLTRAKLEAGQNVFGCDLRIHSPEIIEILGALGFDFVRLNLEHEAYDEREIVHCIRAAESFGVTPMIRLGYDADVIRRFLEVGVQGVHVARINTAEAARQVVDAVKFHPIGTRTFSASGRTGDYGFGASEREVLEFSNREVMIILQVEEAEGVKNLDDILAVPHVDAIQVGPKDLWQSMGFADTEDVWTVVEGALRRIAEAKRWSSMVFWVGPDANLEKMTRYGQLGVRMVGYLQRELIAYGGKAFLDTARSILATEAKPRTSVQLKAQ